MKFLRSKKKKRRKKRTEDAPFEVDLALLLLLLSSGLNAFLECVQILLLPLLEGHLALEHLLLLEVAPLFELPGLQRVRFELDLMCFAVAACKTRREEKVRSIEYDRRR